MAVMARDKYHQSGVIPSGVKQNYCFWIRRNGTYISWTMAKWVVLMMKP